MYGKDIDNLMRVKSIIDTWLEKNQESRMRDAFDILLECSNKLETVIDFEIECYMNND